MARGDREQARRRLEQARGVAGAITGGGAVELSSVQASLLLIESEPARRAAIAGELVAVRTRLVGARHPLTLSARSLVASLDADPARARTALVEVCDELARYHPTLGADIGDCGYEAAWLAALAGTRDVARAAATVVVAAAENGALVVHVAAARAVLQILDGDPRGAVGSLVELARIEASQPAAWWHQLYIADAAALEVIAHLDANDRVAATAALARSQRIHREIARALPAPVAARRSAMLAQLAERARAP
jgi:hypothetical protein